MIIEYNEDEMYERYRLTDEQVKACKKVFNAMRAAGKLGVEFFDRYGTLSAYNGNVFSDYDNGSELNKNRTSISINNINAELLVYSEMLDNFSAGCADDYFYLVLKDE